MASRTFYIKCEDEAVIKRAAKLILFHEDRSFSQFIADEARKIVEKYESPTTAKPEEKP